VELSSSILCGSILEGDFYVGEDKEFTTRWHYFNLFYQNKINSNPKTL